MPLFAGATNAELAVILLTGLSFIVIAAIVIRRLARKRFSPWQLSIASLIAGPLVGLVLALGLSPFIDATPGDREMTFSVFPKLGAIAGVMAAVVFAIVAAFGAGRPSMPDEIPSREKPPP